MVSKSYLTVVVGADLECLVSSHDQPSLPVLLVLQQPNIASATLFPFSALSIELEELGSHFESLLFCLLVGLGLDSLCQVYHRLELDICLFLFGLLLLQ